MTLDSRFRLYLAVFFVYMNLALLVANIVYVYVCSSHLVYRLPDLVSRSQP